MEVKNSTMHLYLILRMLYTKGGKMLQEKVWIENEIEPSEIESLSKELGISRIMSKVLLNRGLKDADSIKKFISPSLDNMNDPFMLKDMDKAVNRIEKAIAKGEKTIIFGDYDVDGITGTSILYSFLKRQSVDVHYYIPDRIDEGYGLSISALQKIREENPNLIITVDCGISAIEEVNFIKESNIDIIVTDHHQCGETIPNANAVINPHRPDCKYPFKELAGVGVTFRLIDAVCKKMGLGEIYLEYLDLVALGTIADLVPLLDENRIIAKYGMQKMRNSNNLGMRTLVECAGINDKDITAGMVAFVIAPRINAAGRLGDAARAVELFTTSDEKKALKISIELNEENNKRQNAQTEIYEQAVEIIEKEIDLEREKVIVVAKEGWHPGIIGIVASKITDKYYKPCIMICSENGIGKGSGRSIEAFNLFEALSHCKDILIKYGGHELAAGLTIDMDRIGEFRKVVNQYADSVLQEKDLIPRLMIEAYLSRKDISLENVQELKMLAPFGQGNPGPVFAYKRLRISEIKPVGDKKHLKMVVKDGTFYVDAIGFNMGEYADIYSDRDFLDLAFSLEINTWNSVESVQLNLKDIKPNDEILPEAHFYYELDKRIELKDLNDYNSYSRVLNTIKAATGDSLLSLADKLIPERMELAAVYKYIRTHGNGYLCISNLFAFSRQISNSYKVRMNYFKVKKSIEIFEELNLLKKQQLGSFGMQVEILNSSKTNLEKSSLYIYLQKLKDYLERCAK